MNSARLAKMRCPNCDSVGTIDIDDIEAQMYCTECCLVLEMNLGESDQTRYDGDENNVVLREAKESDDLMVEGGGKGAVSSGPVGMSKASLGGGKKNDAVYDYIQCLQRRTDVSDAIAIGSVALYGLFTDKLKAKTGRANLGGDGGQNAVASAVFSITAARKGKTIPLADLARITRDLSGGSSTLGNASEAQWAKNILMKRTEVARTLGIEAELRALDEAEFDHLARHYHSLLGWPLRSCTAAAAFARNLNRELSTAENSMTISKVEAVAVGMYMTRASKKLSSLVVAAPLPLASASAGPQQPSTSEILLAICQHTKVDINTMKTILTLLQKNKPAFDKLLGVAIESVYASGLVPRPIAPTTAALSPATATATAGPSAPSTAGQKRPRDDNEVTIVRPS